MGPIALFDKSFLQGISVDEAVWFDRLFLAVVCPVFYVETLADLAKEPSKRGPAEVVVKDIANKFPDGRFAAHVSYRLSNRQLTWTSRTNGWPYPAPRRPAGQERNSL